MCLCVFVIRFRDGNYFSNVFIRFVHTMYEYENIPNGEWVDDGGAEICVLQFTRNLIQN